MARTGQAGGTVVVASVQLMPIDISLRCDCGKLRGTALAVSPDAGCRVICYCDDCQAFARFLARPGITDEWGGTDIFQMAPSRVRITGDADTLSCVRLSAKGMYRWYCGECKTPVGNSNGPRVPFIGLIHAFMDHEHDGRSRDDVLGKPIGYTRTQSAVGISPAPGRDSSPLRLIGRSVRLLGTWWLTGAGSPSAFFDDQTRAPRTEPRILDADERRSLAPGAI
jgi:hypothetical protein